MQKRGVENTILFLGTLVISIVIAVSLLGYVSNFTKGGYFERKFISKDIALIFSAAQVGIGSWDYIYPENLTRLDVDISTSKNIVRVKKLNSNLESAAWFSNNSKVKWNYEFSSGKLSLHKSGLNSDLTNTSELWSSRGIVSEYNFTWPVKDPLITSPFGSRTNPITGDREFHTGIDIVSKDHAVNVPIYAVDNGVVIKTRNFCRGQCNTYTLGYGNFVYIDHGKIKGHNVRTFYAHLKNTSLKKGDVVQKGELIGYMGSTGFSTGKHLHFEVEVDGSNVDPIKYLPSLKKGLR